MTTLPLSCELLSQAPKSLKFYSGGFFGSSLWLEWDGTNLWRKREIYGDRDGTEYRGPFWVCLQCPESETWLEVRRTLDEVKAWKWPRKGFCDNGITDGWQWELALEWGKKRFSSHGSNASPKGFIKVELVLERLAKGRAAPGFPSAFTIEGPIEQKWVRFDWDGRCLHWCYWISGGRHNWEGNRGGIPPKAWKRFIGAYLKARKSPMPNEQTSDVSRIFQGGQSKRFFELILREQPSSLWVRVLLELVELSEVPLPFI